MNRKIELLAPGGDIDSIKAAIVAGADAVYCGIEKFNARNRATNISFNDLNGILRLAHTHQCQVYLTLNIIVLDSEIPALFSLLNKLVNTSIDGIIVQDLGLFYLLSKYFKSLKIHASTQLTTHNEGQIQFLSKLNATRVNLSRELNISEIRHLTSAAHSVGMLSEVFVHGSNCISFSGLCYMSSVHGGNSGNRGRCSQPCRDQYLTTPAGKDFPLNLKDNSAFTELRELADAGVDSLKIEGRIKKFHYVYTLVDAWQKQLTNFYEQNRVSTDTSALYKVFNRDFSNAFLKGEISNEMFIDNPRDHSAVRLAETEGSANEESLEKAKGDIYDERTEIIRKVENEISQISILRAPVSLHISGENGKPLKISVSTPDGSFEVLSEINLTNTGIQPLNPEMLTSRLKAINDTEYHIENVYLDLLQPELYLPFKELTAIKKRLLFILNNSREYIESVDVPVLKKLNTSIAKPSLSFLISSREDLHFCNDSDATVYFQIPNSFISKFQELIEFFTAHKNVIPWFPAVLIGKDYSMAVELLHQLKPTCIVTENNGIAYEACKQGIQWIAGPSLNTVNSYSLLCLKEVFNCSGAFISNEVSKVQLKGIKCPDDFKLYFSMYHPIVLMTSRVCLFHQVNGCNKNNMDDTCLTHCEKSASITNLKNETFFIEKSKGDYNRIYNEINYLNTNIQKDFPALFSGFMIDLRNTNTRTHQSLGNSEIIALFRNLLNGVPYSKEELNRNVYPTTNVQYEHGI